MLFSFKLYWYMIRVCKISANLCKNIFKRKINLYIYFKSGIHLNPLNNKYRRRCVGLRCVIQSSLSNEYWNLNNKGYWWWIIIPFFWKPFSSLVAWIISFPILFTHWVNDFVNIELLSLFSWLRTKSPCHRVIDDFRKN